DLGGVGIAEDTPVAPRIGAAPDALDVGFAALQLALTGGGQVVHFLLAARVHAQKTFVFQLLQRGIDRARARVVRAARALGKTVHQLVAVAGLLAEERQQRQPQFAGAEEASARRLDAQSIAQAHTSKDIS